MIRGDHAREEMKVADKVMSDPKASTDAKISVIYKLVTVAIKLVLSVRTNTTLLMKKLEVGKVVPSSQKKEGTETPKTEAE